MQQPFLFCRLDQVVIHVGALSLKDSQELARHAAEIGADGIAVIAPFFLKPTNKEFSQLQLDDSDPNANSLFTDHI